MPVTSAHEVVALIRFSRISVIAAFAAVAFAAASMGARPVLAQSQQPPPPPTPNPNATPLAAASSAPGAQPTPIPVLVAPTDVPVPGASASAAPSGRHHRGHGAPAGPVAATPEPTPTPTAPGFATLDGSWEVELQHPDSTDYSYLDIKQSGTILTGSWKVKKATYPFEDGDCTYDGKLIRIVVKTPAGDQTFAGYVENGTDMVGTLDIGGKSDPTPFTAGHRGKDKGLFGAGLSPAGLPVPGQGGNGAGQFPH